jgi:hypothetical protein
MNIRNKRAELSVLQGKGATGFLSTTHFRLALHHLAHALDGRWDSKYKTPNTHRSEHAIGAIVFCVSGIEALANTLIWWGVNSDTKEQTLNTLASASIRNKIENLMPPGKGVSSDLNTLINLRDEIIHFIPVMSGKENVPPWIKSLQDSGILLGAPELSEEDGYFLFVDRLCSYRLAYWVFEVTEATLILLMQQQKKSASKIEHDIELVRRFRAFGAPGSLPS